MKKLSQATLLAASLLMVGCTDLPTRLPSAFAPAGTVAATGKLVLTPRIVDGGYAVSSVVAQHTAQSIDHLVIKLFVLDQDDETPVLDAGGSPVQVDLGRDELSNPITIAALRANRTYRVRAYAYRAAGTNTADLISKPGESFIDVDVTTNDQPTMEQLKVTLTNVVFSGSATSSGVTVIDGGYSPIAPESISVGTNGALQAKSGDFAITNTTGGYLEPVRIGNRVYQMGGYSTNTTVMVANLLPEASMSTFVDGGVSLTRPRRGFRRAVIGNYLYVFGGHDPQANVQLSSIEAAPINSDGTLGAFQLVSSQLVAPRSIFGLYVGGDKVYVLGGTSNGTNANSTTQVAPINPDGTLGAFVTNPDLTLPLAMSDFATVRANGALYLLGSGQGARNTVLKAPINPDGSLGSFQDTGVTLATGRGNASGAFVGGKLYVIGGFSASSPQSSIEAATLNSDGTLGAFSAVGGVTLTSGEWGHESLVAGNALYVFTGDHVQRFPIQ